MIASEPQPPAAGGSAEWTDPAFARIARWLHAEAGLVFPPARRAAVEGSLRRVMAENRLRDPESLRSALEAGGPIVDAVIGELTIGETYFFREPRQLEVIRDLVFPALADRDASRPFRAWSAGCASGEEPYTLAIMVREAGLRCPVRIVGTDLASSRLAAARRGRYTRWSFRGVPERIVERYFVPERKHFVLDASVREAVDFRVLNLVEDAYPSAAAGVERMDLILCRNVLIYFDAETVQRVIARLLDTLTDDGWLFLGASDPMIDGLVPCERVLTEAGLAYRRPRPGQSTSPTFDAGTRIAPAPARWTVPIGDETMLPPDAFGGIVRMGALGTPAPSTVFDTDAATSETTHTSASAPTASAPAAPALTLAAPATGAPTDAAGALAAYAAGDYDRSAMLAQRALASASDESVAVVLVRSLANRGRLVEAGAASAAALERHAGSAELEYLRALLLDQAGHAAAAVTAARRALYLDRRLVVAHLLLGELLARTGDAAGSTRAFRNAEALLAPMPADAAVPSADGAPVARLLHIARARAAAVAGGGR